MKAENAHFFTKIDVLIGCSPATHRTPKGNPRSGREHKSASAKKGEALKFRVFICCQSDLNLMTHDFRYSSYFPT